MRKDSDVRILLSTLLLCALAASVGQAAAPADPLDEGIARYQAGRYADALPFFLQATAQRPDDARGWIWLGANYVQLQRWNEAVQALQRAIALDPQNAAAHLLLGVALTRLGQPEQARAAFERARTLGGDTVYGSAAAQWLAFLAAPRGTPAPPVVAPAGCPAPPQLPAVKPPAAIPEIPANIKITDWNVSVAGEQLVIEGTVDNEGNTNVQDVRIQATGFSLTGNPLGSASVTLAGPLEAGDGRNFALRVGTTPPPMWERLEIVNFIGRGAGDRLHAILIPVPAGRYTDLSRARVKIATSTTPPTAAREHLMCAWIADAAGFPVESVRARLTATGTTAAGSVPQVQSVDLAAGQAVPIKLSWTAPATVTVKVDVESVRLGLSSRE